MLEALYQVTFEEAPIGIGHMGLDGRWSRVNPRLAEILDRPAVELVHRPLREEIFYADRERFDADIRKVIAGSLPKVRAEYRFARADGTTLWVALTVSLIRDTEGDPVQLAIMEDLTEKKRLADALAASELRFARLAEMGFVGVFEESRDGTIEAANAAFLCMIGRSANEVRERRVSLPDMTPEEHRAADEEAWKALATTGVCPTYEKDYVRQDGRRITVLVGGVGNDTRFVACAFDVTAFKDVVRERARVVRELEDSIRTRDDFLSLAAHELRTPLTPLRILLDNLLRRVRGSSAPLVPSAIADDLASMKRATSRLTQLVDNLLEASRVTVGRIPLELEDLDLSATVRDVVDRMRLEIERAHSPVALRADTLVVGRWDRARMEQIVANLLSNAIKYGANTPIEICVETHDGRARLVVQDHGIGIAPEHQTRVFDRFERAAPVRQYGGFGIGLWIVRKLVEASGGTVRVDSRPGEGARFTVELPLATPTPCVEGPIDGASADASGGRT